MNQIPQDKINEIINSTDIVDLISDYVTLTPRGKNFFGVCPFHDDSNPSMSVSKDKQIYKCFPCGATGGVVTFLMDYKKISYIEALKELATRANIHLDIKQNYIDIKQEKFKNLYEIYEVSTKFYHNVLKSQQGREAREYLHNRGITDEIIDKFRIGLSLNDRSTLVKFLNNNKFEKKDMLKTGLILDNNNGTYDSYKNRIMFPLEDIKGKIVGFSGRIYNTEDNSKYINTTETEIFKKGETLYNYYNVKDIVRKKGSVIIMEGFMDVISSYTAGFDNVIATMGTAITSYQANIISKMAKEIILCFDGDAAGLKATNSCIKELSKLNIKPKVIRLEDNLDPDEFIKKYGKEEFQKKIDDAVSSVEFKINSLKDIYDLNDTQDKAIYTKEAIALLNDYDDEIMREILLQKLVNDSGLSIEFLRNKLKKIISIEDSINMITKVEPQRVQKRLNKYDKAQINLIYYMLTYKEAIAIYDKRVNHMPKKEYRLLANEILEYFKKYKMISVSLFINHISNNSNMKETLNFILDQNLRDELDTDEIIDYSSVINEYNINEKINRLTKQLENTKDIEVQKKCITEIKNLVNLKMSN